MVPAGAWINPDFLVNIILLMGRNVKRNLWPILSFLWKLGRSFGRPLGGPQLVLSLSLSRFTALAVCCAGWRGGCASRVRNWLAILRNYRVFVRSVGLQSSYDELEGHKLEQRELRCPLQRSGGSRVVLP